MLRFASLGSGSGGNALLVEAAEGGARTRVLIDCGFSARQCALRLERRGVAPESIDAIVVTHEHSDHVAGVAVFSRRHRVPVYCSEGTARAAGLIDAKLDIRTIGSGSREAIGAVELKPFAVSHDAAEPLQFVLSDGAKRLGVVTDLGCPTELVEGALMQVDALVLECNHDPGLLAAGPYPAFLKARVAGDRGHLSNQQAAGLLARIDRRRLRHLVAAHLSTTNNAESLARAALVAVLGDAAGVVIATQSAGSPWLEL